MLQIASPSPVPPAPVFDFNPLEKTKRMETKIRPSFIIVITIVFIVVIGSFFFSREEPKTITALTEVQTKKNPKPNIRLLKPEKLHLQNKADFHLTNGLGGSQKEIQQNAQSAGKNDNITIKDPKAIIRKLASKLTDVERNKLEHDLASSEEEGVDEMVSEMLEDGFMDLSVDEDGDDGITVPGIANARMNSAIRVAGLRGDESAVDNIIGLASHEKAEESTVRASYEAMGYIGNDKAKSYLNKELNSQTNPFLKSEIILSLSTANDTSNIDKYLRYLNGNDPDLRNSAIIALGSAKENRAVEPFGNIFPRTNRSSQVLIVQALYKIDTGDAQNLLEKLKKTHAKLVQGLASQEGQEEDID